MHKWSSQNKLHRTAKMALDTGEVKSVADAEKLFLSYKLAINVGANVVSSATLQAATLTAVNAGRRCFLGGVQVSGHLDTDLKIHWKGLRTLDEAIQDLQGQIVSKVSPGIPQVIIGDVADTSEASDFAVRATFDGWSGGVIPLSCKERLDEKKEFIPAGVLAGSLAISEAFQFVRGKNVMAGRRNIGLSLWNPSEVSWFTSGQNCPELVNLPAQIWLIGLGHLGQSFLWTLGLLPYARPNEVNLVLQDYDGLTEANDSTSPLTSFSLIGKMKTRALAAWCENRGFLCRLYERKFDSNFTVANDEPHVALCGVDNPNARAVLEDVGFHRIIEAGLGKGPQEYLAFQIHAFPGPQKAKTKWQSTHTHEETIPDKNQPAYQALAEEGLDKCGLTMLAGRSVGASFVGLFTSSIVVAELIRMAHGHHQHALIDGTLRSIESLNAIKNDNLSGIFNPGVTDVLK